MEVLGNIFSIDCLVTPDDPAERLWGGGMMFCKHLFINFQNTFMHIKVEMLSVIWFCTVLYIHPTLPAGTWFFFCLFPCSKLLAESTLLAVYWQLMIKLIHSVHCVIKNTLLCNYVHLSTIGTFFIEITIACLVGMIYRVVETGRNVIQRFIFHSLELWGNSRMID